jgi:peptide/nickel transport system ATP-binding protein
MRPLVTLRSLSVTYAGRNHAALRPLDLDILDGEKLAVIGESGSGKSTLALAIAGLLPATARIGGDLAWPKIRAVGRHRPQGGRDFGFVFQDSAASLDPVMPIGTQIAEVARAHLGLGWPQAHEQAKSLLARVRLPDPDSVMGAYPHQLSGGQKQRVALAAAIAAGPRLLIADEATSALDTIVQAEIIGLIRRLVEENGMTLLFVGHDIALAAELCDRIAVFREGDMVELGETGQVISQPRHAYTRALLAAHIGLDAEPLRAGARHG